MSVHEPVLYVQETLPPLACPGRPGRPLLLPSRAHEVALALEAVGHAQGGYIWTAPVGTGKSSLLELTLDALATTTSLAPHVVVHLTARPAAPAPAPQPWLDADLASQPRALRTPPSTADELIAAAGAIAGQLVRNPKVPASEHLQEYATGTIDPLTCPDVLGADLAQHIRDALSGVILVVVVDDLDDLDDASRTLTLDLVAHHQIPAVLLAAASRISWDTPLPYPIAVRKLPALTAPETLRLLAHQHRVEAGGHTAAGATATGVSPAVAGALTHQLGGNTACIIQTAAELTPAQLAGTSILPNPLPSVPALAELHGPALAGLSPADRRVLLIAAVTVTDRTEVLLAAAGTTMEDIVATPLATLLRFAGGRFAFVNLGLRALVHAEATVAERTDAHGALAQAMLDAGMRDGATWHRTLSSLAGDPHACLDLIAIAERLIEGGDAVHAHEVAREAACQGGGRDRAAAERLAGIAALRSGHVGDAVEWLRPAMRSDDLEVAACALPAYVVSVAAHHGQVPGDDIAQLIDGSRLTRGNSVVASGVVRALAISGRIHAERGEPDLSLIALDAARALASTCGPTSSSTADILAVETTWASMFTALTADEHVPATAARSADRQAYASTGRALRLALAGDLDGAARLLSHALATLSPLHDRGACWAMPERAASPFAEAHLRVAKCLVDMWAGDFGRASDELHAAAFRLPVTLPLGGLGTAAARRLSVLRTGDLDDVAIALGEVSTVPSTPRVRSEARIDRVLVAALAGHPHRSERTEYGDDLLTLSSPTTFPALPGLPDAGTFPGPAALSAAYVRAHRELTVGRALARTSAHDRALDHLRSSVELFSLTGAHAWTLRAATEMEQVAATASRSHTGDSNESAPGPAPSTAAFGDHAPMGVTAPQERWTSLLTQRELAVAQLVVHGASNRDVAQALHLSVRTVEVHLGRVFRKTGARSRVALTVLAHATGRPRT